MAALPGFRVRPRTSQGWRRSQVVQACSSHLNTLAYDRRLILPDARWAHSCSNLESNASGVSASYHSGHTFIRGLLCFGELVKIFFSFWTWLVVKYKKALLEMSPFFNKTS
jgi:hypothetical protein